MLAARPGAIRRGVGYAAGRGMWASMRAEPIAATIPFGALVRRHRVAAGLSQEALAERAGLSRRGIADLERGARRFPYGYTLRRLADALGLAEPETRAFLAAGLRPRHTVIDGPIRLPI